MKFPLVCWAAALVTLFSQCQPSPENNATAEPVFVVAKDTCALGEGAFWYAEAQEFWWVDIEGKALHVLETGSGTRHQYPVGSRLGTVVPDTEGHAILALEGEGIVRYDRAQNESTPIAHPLDSLEDIRYNDGKCDPSGRLWVGSMHLEQITGAASLYRVDPDGSASKWRDSVTISNGLCWSADRQTMYYIDTPTGTVRAFSYQDAEGSIDEGRVVVTIPDSLGFPDGMTIDAEDKLWIALWNGNSVTRWDPETGKLMEQIAVPAHNVSSCAFGGANLDTLFITTARVDMTPEELARFPDAGSVFGTVPGVKGAPMHLFGQE